MSGFSGISVRTGLIDPPPTEPTDSVPTGDASRDVLDDKVHEVVIIGSGPAGLTAAIYAARANLEPILIEGMIEGGPTGGQLTLTTDVENFPGFADGIMGPELIQNMREQAERFGTHFITEDVVKVNVDQQPATLETASGRTISTEALIVATGAKPRRLDVPGEDELWGAGVSACATCDGFFFRDKHVIVVGGGDSAMEEATFLTKFAAKVTVIHRRDALRASVIMQERAFKNDKIDFVFNAQVTEIKGENGIVSGVALQDTVTGETSELTADGLFLAIGHIPNTWLFDGVLETDDDGYLIVDEPSTATNVPGVFACGDVMDHTYRQAITAAGTGCRAAMDAERFLAGGAGRTAAAPDAEPATRQV
jgi:thioredoxin reductase (NADPH)